MNRLIEKSENAISLESRIILNKNSFDIDNFHAASVSLILLDYNAISDDFDYEAMSKSWSSISFEAYETLTILAWSDDNHTNNDYAPNSITNLEQLLDFSHLVGCKAAIQKQLTNLEAKFQSEEKTDKGIMIGINLAVRRPYKIQGERSSIEFMPYLMYGCFEKSPIGHHVFSLLSPVKALGQRHSLSRKILAKLNGTNPEIMETQLHIFGCGSLGSKLVSHLAKGGIGKYALYDNSDFSPHNSARHILDDTGVFSGQNKSTLLASYVKRHRSHAVAYPFDVCSLLSENFTSLNSGIIIDTTASLHISDAISAADWLAEPIVQAGLYASGSIGFISRENLARSVRVSDIQSMLSDIRIDDGYVMQHLPDYNPIDPIPVGHGCSSYTMVVADDVITEFSSGMSQLIKTFMKSKAEDNAQLWLGFSASEGPGINWKKYEIEPFISIKADGWDIRISKPASDKINQISLKYEGYEYGGVLLGAISTSRRRLTITRVIDAPSDSVSSKSHFELGTSGLSDTIIDLKKRSGNELTYLGTWHSHPNGGGPSVTDRDSTRKISQLRLGTPSTLLIWTPEGYQAAVEPKADEQKPHNSKR